MATITEKIEMYKGHPTGPVTMIYYPKSHKYKVNGEEVFGVSKTPDTIDKPGLRFYNMTEAVKGAFREVNPNNNPSFEMSFTFREWFDLFGRHKMDFQKKNKRGADNGTSIHEWLEKFFTSFPSRGVPALPDKHIIEKLPDNPTYDQLDTYEKHNEWNNLVDALEEFVNWIEKQTVEVIALEQVVYSKKHHFAGRFDAILRINGQVYLVDFKTNNPSSDFPDGIFPTMFDQIGGYDVAYTEEFYPELDKKGQSFFDGHVVFNFSKKTGRFKKRFTKNDEVLINRQWFIDTLGTRRTNEYYEYEIKQEHKSKKKG